jgi:hypothetical protein
VVNCASLVARPDKPVAELLAHLGLALPTSPKIIENVVEKIAFDALGAGGTPPSDGTRAGEGRGVFLKVEGDLDAFFLGHRLW